LRRRWRAAQAPVFAGAAADGEIWIY